MKENYRYGYYLLFFLLLISILRVVYIRSGHFELIPDEAHYWEWSRRLDLSYYSKGPAVAYVIAFFTSVFGNDEVGVRIGAVLFSVLTSVVLYFFTLNIFDDRRAAFFSVLLANLTPLYSAGSILMTTDAPFISMWILSLFCLSKALSMRSTGFWLLSGVFTGIGLLCKYTMGMLFPVFLLYLLLSPRDRNWLLRKEPYVAFLTSVVIFSPVLIWNARHDWVTVRHVLGQAHFYAGLQIAPVSSLSFLTGQVVLITPLIFIGVAYAIVRSAAEGYFKGNSDYQLLFITSGPVFFFFFLKSLQGKVQGNWTAPAYLTAFVAAGGMWSHIYTRMHEVGGHDRYILIFRSIVVLSFSIAVVLTAAVHYPELISYVVKRDLITKAPYNRFVGWREAGIEAGHIYRDMGRNNHTFIVADTYQTASELAFYVPGKPVVYNLYTKGRRMNQYDIWPGFESYRGSDALYVKGGDSKIETFFAGVFDRCTRVNVAVKRGFTTVRVLTLYKCYNFRGLKTSTQGSSF